MHQLTKNLGQNQQQSLQKELSLKPSKSMDVQDLKVAIPRTEKSQTHQG